MEFPSSTLSANGSLKSSPLDQGKNGEAFPLFPLAGQGSGGKMKCMAGQLYDKSLQRNFVSDLSGRVIYIQAGWRGKLNLVGLA